MLSVSCKDEFDGVLAQTHFIEPSQLWDFIASVYEGYFNIKRADLVVDSQSNVLLRGSMVLGRVTVGNSIDMIIKDGDNSSLSEVTLGERTAPLERTPHLFN